MNKTIAIIIMSLLFLMALVFFILTIFASQNKFASSMPWWGYPLISIIFVIFGFISIGFVPRSPK